MPVYRVCLKDRKTELVVNLAKLGPLATGAFGQWTGLTPDGLVSWPPGISASRRFTRWKHSCRSGFAEAVDRSGQMIEVAGSAGSSARAASAE